MGAGSWAMKEGDLYAGETPVNMSAWSRHAAGFINPQILTSSDNDVQIVNQQAAIVNLDPYLQEFGPRLYVEKPPQAGLRSSADSGGGIGHLR